MEATMRSLRILLASVGLFAPLVGAAAPADAEPTQSPDVSVTVIPDAVTAGSHVLLRATCGRNDQAIVESEAFGTAFLQPSWGHQQAEKLVPAETPPGLFEVRLTCDPSGAFATNTMSVKRRAAARTTARPTIGPTMGPHTGGGYLATNGGGDTDGRANPAAWIAVGGACLIAAGVIAARSSRRVAARRRAVR
jgi:hypothetical protein